VLRWTDNHCHLPVDESLDDVLVAARTAGVERLVTVGTDVASSVAAIEVARDRPGVYATAGVHPHDAAGGLDGLGALVAAGEVVAVGECGLDYHYDHSPRSAQREVFAVQVALAREHGLPLVIHTREAWDDTFAVLDEVGVPERTILHCFTGGPDEADACLDRGMYVSFSGIVTFPSAPEVRAAAVRCPSDRLLVETDAPYLAPVPHRGRRNQPAWVTDVGAFLATARGVGVAEVARITWDNAESAFVLDR